MFAVIDTEARKCTATNSHDTSPPSSCASAQTRDVSAIEFASNHPLRSFEKLKEGVAAYKTTVTESHQAKVLVTNIVVLAGLLIVLVSVANITDIAQVQEQKQQQQTTSHKKSQDNERLCKVKVFNDKYSHKMLLQQCESLS